MQVVPLQAVTGRTFAPVPPKERPFSAIKFSASGILSKGIPTISAASLDVNVEFLIKKNPFSPGNIYIDKLVCEIRELDVASRKELCAKIIEDLWKENS